MEEPDRISIMAQRIAELKRKPELSFMASWLRALLRTVILVPLVRR